MAGGDQMEVGEHVQLPSSLHNNNNNNNNYELTSVAVTVMRAMTAHLTENHQCQ